MGSQVGLLVASFLLVFVNALFVAADYALISCRRSSIESRAKKGDRAAVALLAALDDMGPYLAGVQIAITMLSIAVGLVAEPFLSELILGSISKVAGQQLPPVGRQLVGFGSLVLITYFTVVFGELVPKYLSLQRSEEIALKTIRPLRLVVRILRPLVFVAQRSAGSFLKVMGVSMTNEDEAIPKEELLLMIRSGGSAGVLEKTHAQMVSRALRLDVLAARDIMIHRLDMKWLNADLTREELLEKLKVMPFNRMPVCRGDIDDLVGVVYLHDIVKNLDAEQFSLEQLARKPVRVPESLTLDRMVEMMRTEKTQMLIVVDEYGGTSGLVTLEDVIEEVFGELEDSLEHERPPVRIFPGGRVSAKADLRYDELLAKLEIEEDQPSHESLATIVVDSLGQVPKLGDTVQTSIGLMRVENMARNRITRVGIQLPPELTARLAETKITERR
jgi:CBS domain containing-hemolysin-like protein